MASKRLARLNEQLKRELSEMIRTDVQDPRVGLVTVTGVETAGDLGSARVFVRVTGDRTEVETTLEGLKAAAPFLRTALGRTLHVRKVPELRFREDQSFDQARRIEEVLSDVLPDGLDSPTPRGEAGDDGAQARDEPPGSNHPREPGTASE